MLRAILLVALTPLLMAASCPIKEMTVYEKARYVLGYHPTALLVADAIVQRWAKKQTDETKVAEVTAKYSAIKLAIDEGVASIQRSIDVAEEAGKPVDLNALREKLDRLVQKALDFALALEDAIAPTPVPAPPSPDPTSMPST